MIRGEETIIKDDSGGKICCRIGCRSGCVLRSQYHNGAELAQQGASRKKRKSWKGERKVLSSGSNGVAERKCLVSKKSSDIRRSRSRKTQDRSCNKVAQATAACRSFGRQEI